MTYPGGKNGAGVYQRIINNMPPHKVYVEAFLGSGAVLRNKAPADRNIAIDLSDKAICLCMSMMDQTSHVTFYQDDALDIIPDLQTFLTIKDISNCPDTLFYLDPPYQMETRKSGPLYDYEMSDRDHKRLLRWAKSTRAMVMISGYRSPLYDEALMGWTRIDYMAQTRQGMVEECLWMNFKRPVALHDYSHLGGDFREREKLKRKKNRWVNKIANMPRQERLMLMDALTSASD